MVNGATGMIGPLVINLVVGEKGVDLASVMHLTLRMEALPVQEMELRRRVVILISAQVRFV